MREITLSMHDWYIKDATPYINIGKAGENNAVTIFLQGDDLIYTDETEDRYVEYFLDICDENDILSANTQKFIESQQTLSMPIMREFLGKEGVKLLQVRCVVTNGEKKEVGTYESNVFHATVKRNSGFAYKYDLAYFQQIVNMIKSTIESALASVMQNLMDKTVYDTNANGVVDNAEKVKNPLVIHYGEEEPVYYDGSKEISINISSGGGGGSSYAAGDGINIHQGIISADTVVFIGTREEWEQLTAEEKNKYNLVNFTNDPNVIDLVNSIIAYSIIPLPSVDFLHKTIIYVGETNATQVKGTIYRCEYVNNEYVWITLNEPNGGESELADLTDVAILNPTDGQYLRYNNTTHKWENVNGGSGETPDITVTASVSNTTGTPNVEVTKSGTLSNPTFDLAFSGLKGESSIELQQVYSTDTGLGEYTIVPNKLYVFDFTTTQLEIHLDTTNIDNTRVNDYHFTFKAGVGATLTLPNTVKFPQDFSVDDNTIYEISIVNNLLSYQKWEM